MPRASLLALAAAAALALAASAPGAAAVSRPEAPETVSATIGDLSGQPCGCSVCPCPDVRHVRVIEGLEKLSEAKARAALPLGWRPSVRVDGCPCPVPAPCEYNPCEPPPCPCKHSEFFFADLVNSLNAEECVCPPPKPCTSFPCDDEPPCPCKAGTTFKPELTDSKVVPPPECVGPGACLPEQPFREPEYADQAEMPSGPQPVRTVKSLPRIRGLAPKPRRAPAVTDAEARASYDSAGQKYERKVARAAKAEAKAKAAAAPAPAAASAAAAAAAAASASGPAAGQRISAAPSPTDLALAKGPTEGDTFFKDPPSAGAPVVSISKDAVLPPTLRA